MSESVKLNITKDNLIRNQRALEKTRPKAVDFLVFEINCIPLEM